MLVIRSNVLLKKGHGNVAALRYLAVGGPPPNLNAMQKAPQAAKSDETFRL